MIKKFIPVAALLTTIPAPAQATNVVIDADRTEVLVDAATKICARVQHSNGNAADNLERFSAYLYPTLDEKIFLLGLCRLYLHGYVDGISRGNRA